MEDLEKLLKKVVAEVGEAAEEVVIEETPQPAAQPPPAAPAADCMPEELRRLLSTYAAAVELFGPNEQMRQAARRRLAELADKLPPSSKPSWRYSRRRVGAGEAP